MRTGFISYGDPQTVEVNAKRELGAVTLHWRVNGGREHRAATKEFRGGSRYGGPGVYYHVLRGAVTGTFPGDEVEVWFTARKASSDPFTYDARIESNKKVLILGAEDYTGLSPNTAPEAGPKYLDYYKNALTDAGIGYDVYDVDALGRTAPSYLGVLSHYKAVVWYTRVTSSSAARTRSGPVVPPPAAAQVPRSSSMTRSSRRGTS